MRATISSLTALLLWLGLCPAAISQTAQGQDALYTRSLAASCANCHGTDGKAVAGSLVVPLAGMDKNYFIAQMKAFKAGTRPATVMTQLAKGFNDLQIETLATYFAIQQK
jgi:sulfide dehydrogenase cytochrome subunit